MKKAYIWGGSAGAAVVAAGACFMIFSGGESSSSLPIENTVPPSSVPSEAGKVGSANQQGKKDGKTAEATSSSTPAVVAPVTPPEPVVPPKPPFPRIALTGEMLTGFLPQSFSLAVATSSDEVQSLVLSGMHHLLTNWDSAATYALQRAAALDPDCALAQFGVYLSLSTPGMEREAVGTAAYEKLKTMVKSEGLPDRERAYLEAAVALHDEGAPAAGSVFASIAERWKADLPARLLAALMLHDRYDAQGAPSPNQARAMALLDEALETNPDNHALLFTRALVEEAAPVPSEITIKALKKAIELAPNHAPTYHLYGHFQFRGGDYEGAAKTFENTAALYDKTRNPLNATMASDSGWLKSMQYRAVALFCAGKQNTALEEARRLALLPLDETRPRAEGSMQQEWECQTLPTRLMLGSDSADVLKHAKFILPEYSGKKATPEDKPSELHIKLLDNYLETRIALSSAKDTTLAAKEFTVFKETKRLLEQVGEKALEEGAGSYWSRAKQMGERLEADLFARLNPAEAETWRKTAAEKQLFPSLLMPPTLPYPVEYEWASGLESLGNQSPGYATVPAIVTAGLARFPKHIDLLRLQAKVEGRVLPPLEVIVVKAAPTPTKSTRSGTTRPKTKASSTKKSSAKKGASSRKPSSSGKKSSSRRSSKK